MRQLNSLLFCFCFSFISFAFGAPSVALAAPLADLKISGVRIQLHRSEAGSYKLVILPLVKPVAPGKGGEPVRAFQASQTATQPRRLVVDYYGLYGRGAKNVAISDKRLKGIRIGDHSDRTRIVIDLRGQAPLTFSQPARLGTGDAFRVDFTIALPSPAPRETPSPAASPQPLSSTLPATHSSGLPSGLPSAFPAGFLSGAPSPKPSGSPIAQPDASPSAAPFFTPAITPGPAPLVKPSLSPIPEPSASPLPSAAAEASRAAAGLISGPIDTPAVDVVPREVPATPSPASTAMPVESSGVREAAAGLAESTSPQPSAAETPSPANGADGMPVLKDIGFEKLRDSDASAIYLIVTGLSAYSLERRRDDLYELTIEAAKIAQPGLTLPRFSPEGIDGFDLVVAKEEDGAIVVRIFVEEGVRLFPFIAEGRLWVKALR